MKAYCDESGKHEAATVITICGLLMSARTCKELQRRWLKEAARSPKIPLPFHMSDCVVGSKLFEYLKADEAAREDMQNRMIRTLRGLDTQAYGASLLRAAYKPLEPQMRPDNSALRDPWFLAFEAAILELLIRSEERGKPHPIDLVFDRQDEFSLRAHSLFNTILGLNDPKLKRLNALSFAPKDDIAALQAIDIVTYEVNRCFTDQEKATKAQVQPSPRWQLGEIRKYIEVNGRVWNDEGLTALIEGTNAKNAIPGASS